MVQQAELQQLSVSPYRRIRELALSAAWRAGSARSLVDADGQSIEVVYPGVWSHGFGPDFQGAMIALPDGRLLHGDVELHFDASDWLHHRHHLDPAYNEVILHVVSRNDIEATRSAAGRHIPMAILSVPDELLFRIDARLPDIWNDLGAQPCTPDLAARDPARIIGVLEHLGDRRLGERVVVIEGELACRSGVDVVTTLLLDAMGWSENRAPMRHLADQAIFGRWLTRAGRYPAAEREPWLLAMLAGAGGFLPLAPSDATIAHIPPDHAFRIEAIWANDYHGVDVLAPSAWHRARTRPANHPLARIATGAALLARLCATAVERLTDAVRAEQSIDRWLTKMLEESSATLGASRARAIAGSVVIPFVIAWARHSGDESLEERAAAHWETLRRSDWSRSADRARWQVAGNVPLRGIGERALQGLQTLDRTGCGPRRCFECPIAAERIRDEITRRS